MACCVNVELERIWKEAIVVPFRHPTEICQEGLRKSKKISNRIAGAPAEIRTQNLSYSGGLEHYGYDKL
jgi:hypothetical protein